MPQSLILLKKMPTENYLHDLQAGGVLRASMNFLPGGSYAGAGLFQASPSYALAPPVNSGDTGCPYPDDPVSCEIWELEQMFQKVSFVPPKAFNTFLFVNVGFGQRQDFAHHVVQAAESAATADYVAAAHLHGQGPYNAVIEILSDDHHRLLQHSRQITDHASVADVMVGRVAARDTRGFGEGAAVL